ncbi:MAG TPA: DUF444 family protein [Meiothermus sp.]|nr:DUF444 family protein [Meiothermus sp.]
MRPIERDLQRFKEIVRGEVKKRAREFLTREEYLGSLDGQVVSIPLPQLELPRLQYGQNEMGQGEGDGEGQGQGMGGTAGRGGLGPGGHVPVAEMDIEEFLELIGETLKLPRLEPKQGGAVEESSPKYTTLSRRGPESLRHARKTMRQALKRAIQSGTYQPQDPRLVPERDDYRYRAPEFKPRPQAQAVLVFALDVSGSMEGEQLRLVRILSYWITAWVKKHFPRLSRHYLLHDAEAWEVSEEEFFRLREGGGTRLSSGIKLAQQVLERYPAQVYNRYVYHFTDGDNWQDDTAEALETLKSLLPTLSLYGYAQVRSRYGQGRFIDDLRGNFQADPALTTAELGGREGLPNALKRLLGGGNE